MVQCFRNGCFSLRGGEGGKASTHFGPIFPNAPKWVGPFQLLCQFLTAVNHKGLRELIFFQNLYIQQNSFNPVPNISALQESSPKTGSSATCNSGAHTDSVTLSWVTWTLLSPVSYNNVFKFEHMVHEKHII
jgi:hypothetical protein